MSVAAGCVHIGKPKVSQLVRAENVKIFSKINQQLGIQKQHGLVC
jgi:hypothetical protein